MTILDDIVRDKRAALIGVINDTPLEVVKEKLSHAPAVRDFKAALTAGSVNIIAEVKKASPSKGVIREDFDPALLAKEYEAGGAAAVSVLTEEKYFQGSLNYLEAVRDAVSLPVLRKDFIFEPYQIYEARTCGADALLLIASLFSVEILSELIALTQSLRMTPLVEVHTADELTVALDAGAEVVGINNRDLNTFVTDIENTITLSGLIPDGIVVVSESGISTALDIKRLRSAGVSAFLIGEALAREPRPEEKLKELLTAGEVI
ncbi:MAG: indole-3-glycerol phosphate synthase TrpC [Thermodesulfobacteriota bacterium]